MEERLALGRESARLERRLAQSCSRVVHVSFGEDGMGELTPAVALAEVNAMMDAIDAGHARLLDFKDGTRPR